jgi:mevalonate kinase
VSFGSASIPGKIMLAGEYSVLRGGRALAATVSSQLRAEVALHPDSNQIELSSDLWPTAKVLAVGDRELAESKEPLLQFVDEMYKTFPIRCGASVKINSQLDVRHGLGSSSALRLAVAKAFATAVNAQPSDAWQLAKLAFESQRKHQTQASGYDVATQWLGGTVLFRRTSDEPWPGTVQQLPSICACLNQWVHPFAGGKGAPTATTLISTRSWLDQQNRWDELMAASEALIDEILALRETTGKLSKSLIAAVQRQRHVFEDAPGFPRNLFAELARISGFDDEWTAKTTGAGGEDAILIFADRERLEFVELTLRELGWNRLNSFFTDAASRLEWDV